MRRILLITLLGTALVPMPVQAQPYAEPSHVERVPEPAVPKAEPVEDDPVFPDDAPPKAVIVPEDENGAPAPAVNSAKKQDKDDDEPIDVPAVSRDDAPPINVKPAKPGGPVQDPAPSKKEEKPKMAITLNTDTSARPLTRRVPGPRGQIVDRRGEPLAQNRLGYYLGVQLPMVDKLPDSSVLTRARYGVDWVKRTLPGGWTIPDDKILEHYRKRRWVPLLSDTLVPDDQVEKLKAHLPSTVVLQPFYLRAYPEGSTASHTLGYMQKNGKLISGDLASDELLWTPTIGASGLEQQFDTQLTGKPGLYSVLFNAEGEKVTEEWVERPKAGNTLVTSLDLRFQRIVEREMQADKVRGAFVILDVRTGDVIAICSNPGFDPNERVYGISHERHAALLNDPDKPLLPRAMQGLYPPASTFKIVTALAALESGKVTDDTYFSCPNGMMFSNVWMRNHNKNSEGDMNVVRAIKRSCNTWFFQAAMAAGGANVSAMGIKLGFGDKTGIALPSMELPGRMPTPEYYQKKRGTRMAGGVLANVSIGQGDVEATPLQVAQMMAGVARGDAIPRPRLVRQIQDVDGTIVQSFPPTIRTVLNFKKDSLDAVRKGMRAVVEDGDGTGKEAENKYVIIAGKTGTGEWKEKPKRNVAWFAGFIPFKNPEYAFAAIYEGNIDETVSGGKTVAPLVGNVFNKIYKLKKDGNEMPDEKAKGGKGKSRKGDNDEEETNDDDGDKPLAATKRRRSPSSSAPRPETVAAPAPVLAEPPRARTGLRSFFDRFRRR